MQTGSVTSSQVIAQLPSQEESNSQAIVHLPSQEGSNSPLAGGPPQAVPPREGSNSSTALPPAREGDIPPPQTGQSNIQNRSSNQGLRCSNRHRATQASQENNTVSWEDNITTTPLLGPPRIFQ